MEQIAEVVIYGPGYRPVLSEVEGSLISSFRNLSEKRVYIKSITLELGTGNGTFSAQTSDTIGDSGVLAGTGQPIYAYVRCGEGDLAPNSTNVPIKNLVNTIPTTIDGQSLNYPNYDQCEAFVFTFTNPPSLDAGSTVNFYIYTTFGDVLVAKAYPKNNSYGKISYEIRDVTLSYNSNGGSKTPQSQTENRGSEFEISPVTEDTVGTKTSVITFDSNGGTDVDPKELNWALKPEKSWNTNSAGTGSIVPGGSTLTLTEDTTLYAIWDAPVIYTSQWPDPKYPNDEARFRGWYPDISGGDRLDMLSYTVERDFTAYARWEYQITYDFNGGTLNFNSDNDEIGPPSDSIREYKEYDKEYSISSKYPTKLNSIFKGWGLSADAIEVKYVTGDIYNDNAPLKLYAIYETPTYTVTFKDGYSDKILGQISVDSGYTLQKSDYPPTPKRDGYEFQGWSGNQENIQANTVIKAVWELGIIWIYTKDGWVPYKPKE